MLNRLVALVALAGAAVAGPVEFGRSELDRAIAERRLNTKLFQIKTQVAVDPAESYRIQPGLITGGDLRGLMYGLIEAAGQVRRTGHLQKVEAVAGMSVRGVRMVVQDFNADVEWIGARDRWPAFFQTLAVDRFNRFEIAVPDLAGLEPNLEALHFISATAADYGVDFTLAVHLWQGPDVFAALSKVLAACPSIRGLRLPADQALAADAIRAIRETGRRVTIELPDDAQAIAELAGKEGLPVLFSAAYPGTSRPTKGDQFYWKLPPSEAGEVELNRLVNKLYGTFAIGFQIDLPPSMLSKTPDPPPASLSLGRLAYDVGERK